MDDLLTLINRFQALGHEYGRSKTTSYQVILYFSPYDDSVEVELGGYDVGDWNRHHRFKTVKSKLVEELTKHVEEAEKIVE